MKFVVSIFTESASEMKLRKIEQKKNSWTNCGVDQKWYKLIDGLSRCEKNYQICGIERIFLLLIVHLHELQSTIIGCG